jgi:hypothetical protein
MPALAWLNCILLGFAAWLALAGRPHRRSDWLAGAGHALPLGLLGCGLLIGLRPGLPGDALAAGMLPITGLALLLLAGVAMWRWRRTPPPATGIGAAAAPLPYWAWLLLALLALRLFVLVDEAWLRPVFVWDAWNAWSLKAKTWFSLGQVPYFSPQAWWDAANVQGHTALAWRYPELLSRVELWLAAGAGAWHEGAVALAWPLLWVALLAGCAGQWRALGVSRVHCLVFTYVLGSLPLLAVHAGLAGYADLWVACVLSFAVLAWLRWLATGERGQLALALACVLLLPLLKFEGAVWALLVLGLGVLREVPARWRKIGLGTASVLVVLVLLLALLLQMPWLALAGDTLSGATGGSTEISRWTAALAFFKGLAGQGNWHLLWPLLAGVLVWQRQRLRTQEPVLMLALLLVGGLAALFCLFVFTPAAKWAASGTATNRLVLHWVPLAVSLLALCLRGAPVPGGKDPSPAP